MTVMTTREATEPEAGGVGGTTAGMHPGEAPGDREAERSDERLERMDRVALLYAEITAATRAFLSALAESDRHRDWAGEGFGSCSEWLTWRLGITRNTANEKIRVAHALEILPRTAEAMGRGELSFSKVRALTRVATPDNAAPHRPTRRAAPPPQPRTRRPTYPPHQSSTLRRRQLHPLEHRSRRLGGGRSAVRALERAAPP